MLDGGLGTELDLKGDHSLWSTVAVISNSSDLKKKHLSFLEAGADIIETATYQASIDGICRHLRIAPTEALGVIANAVAIAREARDEFWENHTKKDRQRPLVAGSIGPYGACLGDMSEFSGSYIGSITKQELIEWHRPRVNTLIMSGVDLLAIETIPAQKEAEALMSLLAEYPTTTAWLSFACKDGLHTCHGENFCDAVKAVMSSDQIVGVGVNCTHPEYIESLLQQLPPGVRDRKAIVVYPNRGDIWDKETNTWSRQARGATLCQLVPCWMDAGATCLGGCCHVTPSDISDIRSSMTTHLERASSDIFPLNREV